MNANQLMQLKEAVDTAREDLNRAEGAQDAALKLLKDDFGCATVVGASKKIESIKKKIETLDAMIEADIEALKVKYGLD